MLIDKGRLEQLKELNKDLGLKLANLELLNTAFIHPSFTNEHGLEIIDNNQRLEFLGDAVLELAVSQYLYNNYKHLAEGQMTKVRAYAVCEQSLSKVSKKLSLGDYLVLGKGEENTKGRKKPSILADTFEALIGAIYLENGFGDAQRFILENLKDFIESAVKEENIRDHKTALQELLQKTCADRVTYNVLEEKGPDHDKTFYVEVRWKGKRLGEGMGKSKKEAEQMAAFKALHDLYKSHKI
ncbi:MAG: ribonuclease III [Tepidanaerobacteraceae bacterium]|jgi:ribonuclease-3